MRNLLARRAFTLVELLVVITILAIISVVAYTSFGGATDKAKNSTKLQHLSTIEGALNLYYNEKNYYPMPAARNATSELWGYDATPTVEAALSNTLSGTMSGDAVASVDTALTLGGGKVTATDGTTQIGAKGTMNQSVLGKQYLSQDLVDPSLKDIKVGDTKVL
jgi:prepilin-type N-terminal cleavage/methylation domain-containing protein